MPIRETDSHVCPCVPRRVLLLGPAEFTDALERESAGSGFVCVACHSLADFEASYGDDDFPVVQALISDSKELKALSSVCRRRKSVGIVGWFRDADFALAAAAVRNSYKGVLLWPGNAKEAPGILRRVFTEVERERFQDDVVCMITHDLKIPLSSVLGYSSLLLDPKRQRNEEETLAFLRVIHSNGLRMLSLIDNFLTTCKIEADRLHLCLDDLDVALFARDLITTFKSELDRHDFHLDLKLDEDMPLIEADETLLFRAVGNMLSNACKFSPDHSRLELEVSHCSNGDNPIGREAVVFRVTNEGAGLEPDEVSRIFEKFRRGSAHVGVDGMGIGSFVLKSIIEAHGGAVSVESVPKQLTTFSAWLPVDGPNS